ncbi:MAG: AtpZ/AtpI family protein [Candidatus Wildermuthbacteria bacterium]|nr:AtpZ/AtpI family protein [Candidatus Wildermuthbacteria bacterium]
MKPAKNKIFKALSFASQFGLLVALPLVAGIALGAWADGKFQTGPILTLFGATLGFGISVFGAFRLLLPFIKNDD